MAMVVVDGSSLTVDSQPKLVGLVCIPCALCVHQMNQVCTLVRACPCIIIITSAEEGGYVFGSVCLSVCLSVCPSDYSQTCERILTKFFGGVGPSDTILVAIRITLRIRESKVRNPDPPDQRRFVLSEHISCY